MALKCWTLQTDPHGHPLYDEEPDDGRVDFKGKDATLPCAVILIVAFLIYWFVTNRKTKADQRD